MALSNRLRQSNSETYSTQKAAEKAPKNKIINRLNIRFHPLKQHVNLGCYDLS
jgi:hypothetical protein